MGMGMRDMGMRDIQNLVLMDICTVARRYDGHFSKPYLTRRPLRYEVNADAEALAPGLVHFLLGVHPFLVLGFALSPSLSSLIRQRPFVLASLASTQQLTHSQEQRPHGIRGLSSSICTTRIVATVRRDRQPRR